METFVYNFCFAYSFSCHMYFKFIYLNIIFYVFRMLGSCSEIHPCWAIFNLLCVRHKVFLVGFWFYPPWTHTWVSWWSLKEQSETKFSSVYVTVANYLCMPRESTFFKLVVMHLKCYVLDQPGLLDYWIKVHKTLGNNWQCTMHLCVTSDLLKYWEMCGVEANKNKLS